MPNYEALYGGLLETATRQLYDRLLGENQIHGNIMNIKQVFEKWVTDGKVERIRIDYEGPFWVFYNAIGFVLGHDPESGLSLKQNVRFWGLRNGVTTVLTREGWFLLGMLDRSVIKTAVLGMNP